MDQATSAIIPKQRVFDHRRIWHLSQDVFERAADLIAENELRYRPQVVVGIARGGLPLARHLAGRLDVETVDITARHNSSDTAYLPATGRVELPGPGLQLPPSGTRLLIVDDICGTGATLDSVTALLARRCAPASVRIAVLCRNAASGHDGAAPDVWVWRLRDWVVFPWEPTPADRDEPIEALAVPDHLGLKEPQ